MDVLKKFTDYIKLWFYFEAHALLEDNLWEKGNKDSKNLYFKGLINAAVAMELIKRCRVEQSNKVWQTYLKYKIDSFHEINHTVEKQYEKITKTTKFDSIY